MKKIEKKKKYVDDINKKLKHHELELTTIPQRISLINKDLMNATMNTFYHTMMNKKEKAAELEKRVIDLKTEIQEAIIIRDEAKTDYQNLYSYIHGVVGPDVIEQYDRYYIGGKDD